MTYPLPLLLAYLAFSSTADGQLDDLKKILGKDLTREVTAVKQPIDETITFIGSSQCSNVKKIVGVAYEQVEGEKEPDLSQLSLNFISSAYRVTYNLSNAVEMIPKIRGFNPGQNLFIFVHGFTDNPTQASFSNISEALLKQGEFNVLALDASSLIRWLYLRSTTYVRFIGEKLGEVLANMVQSGLNPGSIHMIGHSLGSHISSFTGKTFKSLTGQRIGRITGLDPAGPCFSHIDPELRLQASDADFVDVMHTDSGVFGVKDAVGHVDYYPNSGSEQPNCLAQTCSHSRAWLLYTESISNPQAFPAVQCKDWKAFKKGNCENNVSYMGFGSKPDTRGLYYLQTNGEQPFGRGQDGLKFKNEDGIVRNIQGAIFGRK